MKTNLSSQIKLDQIPRRYYDPQGEIELAALTREEKVYTKIFETESDGSNFIAESIARYINRYTEQKGKCVLALGAGRSTHSVYAELIKPRGRCRLSAHSCRFGVCSGGRRSHPR